MKKYLILLIIPFLFFSTGCEKDEEDQELLITYSNLDPNLFGIWTFSENYVDPSGEISTINEYISFSENRYCGYWTEGVISDFIGPIDSEFTFTFWTEGNMLFFNYSPSFSTYSDLSIINEYSVNGNKLSINDREWNKVE